MIGFCPKLGVGTPFWEILNLPLKCTPLNPISFIFMQCWKIIGQILRRHPQSLELASPLGNPGSSTVHPSKIMNLDISRISRVYRMNSSTESPTHSSPLPTLASFTCFGGYQMSVLGGWVLK